MTSKTAQTIRAEKSDAHANGLAVGFIDPADLFSAEDDAAEIRPEFLSDVVQGGGF